MKRSLFWLLDHYPETGETLGEVQATALEHASLADDQGYEALWLAEHHFKPLGTVPNPAVLLAAISQRTGNLRLGPAVSVLPLHNPIHVAEDYALVDMLSEGRLNMGVGTGAAADEYAGMGCDYENRRPIFDEHLAVVQDRWRGATAGVLGIETINVAPVQAPTPPVYVAAMHDDSAHMTGLAGNNMLTLVSPATVDVQEVTDRLDAHARGLSEAGLSHDAAEAVVVVFAHIANSAEEARRIVAPALGRFISATTGFAPPDAEMIYDHMLSSNTGFFGTVEQVSERITRYEELGVGHLAFVSRFGGIPADAAERTLRALAPSS